MKLTIFTKTSTWLFSFQTWVSTRVARLMSVYTEGGVFSLTKSLLTVFLMGLSVTAFAQKYVKVTATGSGNGSSWDNALGASSLKTTIEAGGTVYIAAGTYNPTATITLSSGTTYQIIGGYAANATGTSLTTYNPGANQTIISASAMTAGLKRVFYSTSLDIELKGLVLQDGTQGTTGGAVYVGSGKVLKFTDLVIKNNTAGGIGVYSVTGATASVAFSNCIFTNNTNTGNGGALVCSTVYENPDPFAIAPTAGKFTMNNCSFDGNTASGQGGAIEFTTSHAWEISGTCFSNNTAFLAGGVIFTTSKKNILTGCNFTNNTATTAEGGAMIATTASATLTNCNFVGNTATGTGTGYGGAIFATTASLTMSGTTFYNNTGKAAGAIYSTTWTNSLRSTATNCLFSGNAATNTAGTTAGTNGGGAMVINANANGWDFNGCTFANNTVPTNGWGGAVSHYDAETTFNNTIFYNNTKGGAANISGSDIKNYDNAGHFNTITNSQMQLANAAAYTNQAGGTDATSYGFGSGNTFNNTTNPNVAAAPSITCPTILSSTCATPSVGGTATYTGGTICSTANIGTINLTGQTGGIATWQTSTNGGTSWTDIASTALQTSYNFINAANGQQYRAVVNSGGSCSDAYSTVVTLVTSTTACTTTTCSYNSSSFSPTISTSSNPTYTTHVVLVNPTTGVMDYVTAANSTAFTGVALGDYIMYAITYDNTASPIPTITVGTNISTLTGCSSFSDPLLTKVCCPTIAAPTVSITQPTCGVTTGSIAVTNPTTGVTYSFDNGATFQASATKSGLAAATTYQVLTKDNGNACLSAATPSVINPPSAPPTITEIVRNNPSVLSCPTLNNGQITVTAAGANLRYSKDGGATWQVATAFTSLTGGTTTIRIQDSISTCFKDTAVVLFSPTCTDSDGDGVLDVVDLDNDNDGVKDVNEECKGFVAQNTSGTWNGISTATLTATYTGAVVQTNVQSFNDNHIPFYINSNSGQQRMAKSNNVNFTFNFSPAVPANEIAFFVEDIDLSAGSSGVTLTVAVTGDATTTDFLPVSTGGNLLMNYNSATGVFSLNGAVDNQGFTLKGASNALVSSITVTSSGININDLVAYSLFARQKCDTDGDGVENKLDLDSDQDGCSDAFEASATTNRSSNYTFSAPYGANGLVNTLENNDTQTANTTYTSTYSTKALVVATPSVGGTTATTTPSVCGATNGGTISLTGQTGSVVKWQTSTNGGTLWTDIANTTTTYNFTNAADNQQYRAVVNNNNTCLDANSAVTSITVNTLPSAPTTAVVQPMCSVTTGTISVSNPSSGVTYSFDNGTTFQASATSNALASGTYQVVVKDNTSLCLSTATPSVINPILTVPSAPTTAVIQPTCSVTTGTISVSNPSSGVTYSFDNGATFQASATSSALASGTYQVVVKDNTSLCLSTATPSVINPILTVPSAPTTAVVQPTCSVTTGTISVSNPSSGVTYSFDNGTTFQASATSNALASGTYQVVVKDNTSLCVSTATPSVLSPQPSEPTAPTNVTVVSQPTCATATASVSMNGMPSVGTWTLTRLNTTTAATYVVTTAGSGSTFYYSNVPTGTYTYTVKDNASGCSSAASNSIVVNSQPVTPSVPTVSVTQPTCFVSTGTLTITQPTGAGMTYSIDGTTYTNTTGVFNNVAPATYSVTAKSSDGCISTSSTSATINPVLLAPTVTITQPSCLTPKGLFTITAPVGAGFSYSIDGIDYSNTTGLFSNLDVGTYSVTAKSSSGCISPQTTAVVNPSVPSPVITVSQPNCTVGTGTITVTMPASGVTYSFDNGATFQTSNVKNGLLGGTYYIVIKNNVGGCTTLATPVVINNRPTVGCNCDNTTGNISFTISNQNTTAAYTQQYVLTTDNGLMIALSNTPSFTGLSSGQYAVYALNYETASGVTGLTIGQNISLVSGSCLNTSVPLFFHVCVAAYSCNNATGNITATISSQNNTTTYTQKYVLTDETGNILRLSNTPSFVGLTNGKYQMFAINYETASGVTGLTLNSNILAVAGLCFNLSTPLYYQVCTPPSVYTCNNATGTVTATISNQNASGTYTQKYALTRDDNTILQVANAPTFTGLMDGQYKLYAINYETASGLTGLTVGQNLSGLVGSCFQKSTPLLYQVCLPTFSCNNNSGNITATISGQNTGATFTQKYILTDSVEKILQIATTPTFTGLPNGRYKLYGVNYETASGVTGLTIGQSMTLVTGSCVNKTAPLLYQVCIVPEICNNRIDDDGDGLIDCEDVTDCPSCGCDNTTGNITFTNTGQTTTGYTQVYALTDSTGKILNTSTTAAFNGLASGRYRVYAINYETAKGITGLTIGQSINGVTGSCVNKSLPLLFKVCVCVTFNFKAMLEGPYQTATQTMHTTLNDRGLLPGQTPIGQFAIQTPQGQPYKGLPWNYAGTEGDTITTYPATVVDWVLVSLRLDSTTNANAFRVTGWLHNDGHISFISPCFDLANGAYFVVIEHRNHIGVMSPQKVFVQNGTMAQDFTLNDGYVLTNPPSFGQKPKGSKWVLFAGDGKKDTFTTNFDINFNDSQLWKAQSGIFDQYKSGDFDMNADVNFLDNYLWKSNSGKYSGVPH